MAATLKSRLRVVTPWPSMKILLNGICGFVGHALTKRIKAAKAAEDIFGVDNLTRLACHAEEIRTGRVNESLVLKCQVIP
jgi:nucleoside-diphosphate-sugar epimerase